MVFRTSVHLSEHRTPHALASKRHLGGPALGARQDLRTCAPRTPAQLRRRSQPDHASLASQLYSSSFHWRVVPRTLNPRVREKPAALVVRPLLGRAASRSAKRMTTASVAHHAALWGKHTNRRLGPTSSNAVPVRRHLCPSAIAPRRTSPPR
jgi:hypothetical protein